MQKVKKQTLQALVRAVAIVALAMTPALAKDSNNKKSRHSSAKAASEADGHVPEQSDTANAGHYDSTSGPAWKTIGGTVKNVQGDIYTVEDYEGNQVKLHVGQGRSTSTRRGSGTLFALKLREAASRIQFSNPPFESAHSVARWCL
jgi:uncharacterized protein YdeI (BOF family)